MKMICNHMKKEFMVYVSFLIFIAGLYLGGSLWFIVPVVIMYLVFLYLERNNYINTISKNTYVLSGVFIYFTLIYCLTNVTRMILLFSEYKDLIAFVDVLTFGLVSYLPVFVLSKHMNTILRKQRLILYIIVFVYIAIPIFNIYEIGKSDLDYFWIVLVLDNIINLFVTRNSLKLS